MEITVDRKKLVDCLSLGGSLAGKSKVMEILNYAKVVFKSNGQMLVSSSDNQSFITSRITGISVAEDKEFCVEPNLMLKALKTLSNEQVTLNITEHKIVCKREKGKMEFPITPSEDFIVFNTLDDSRTYEIDSEKLFEWSNNARMFAATENVRPIMCGMLLYADGNEIGCCATDAQKLYHDHYNTDNSVNEKLWVVIPTTALPLICQIINGTDKTKVVVDAKNLTIKTSDSKISVKLIEGNYPNFKAILPKDKALSVNVSVKELIDSISRVTLFAGDMPTLKMQVSGMNMNVSCQDLMMSKQADDDIIVDHSGSDITIGCNSEYILNSLRNVLSDSVRLEMQDATRPIVVKDADRPNKITICMPLMIQ